MEGKKSKKDIIADELRKGVPAKELHKLYGAQVYQVRKLLGLNNVPVQEEPARKEPGKIKVVKTLSAPKVAARSELPPEDDSSPFEEMPNVVEKARAIRTRSGWMAVWPTGSLGYFQSKVSAQRTADKFDEQDKARIARKKSEALGG